MEQLVTTADGKMNTTKGAFKDFPTESQPSRIPLEEFHELAEKVRQLLTPHGQVFIPDAVKKSTNKETTGDLDVFFLPNKEDWKQTVLKAFPNIVAKVSNGPQLMLVVRGLIDDNQYMIDVILSNNKEWNFVQFHHGHGVILPVLLGAFARSLGYKFSRDGLYRRIKSPKGCFRNLLLTHDPKEAMEILGLDSDVDGSVLYAPETLAQWMMSSSRFDSRAWRIEPNDNGTSIQVKNNKSHRAARKKEEVQSAFEIIDRSNKQSNVPNNLEVERKILGDQYIDSMLEKINQIEEKKQPVLTGSEIMQLLNIPSGPEVGKWVKFLSDNPQITDKEVAKLLIHKKGTIE